MAGRFAKKMRVGASEYGFVVRNFARSRLVDVSLVVGQRVPGG